MRILVCGNSGFIGMHLVEGLASAGHSVVGLDLVEPQHRGGLERFALGDIQSRDDLLSVLDGVECVINLAAKHHDFGISEAEFFQTNEGGSRNILDCMGERCIRRYVFFSSVAVYGESDEALDEEACPRPRTPYGASKLAAEEVARNWASVDPGRSVVILRPCLVFGERNTANMFSLIHAIDKGLFVRFGRGQARKSMCYVRNVVDATLWCLSRMTPGVELFNYVDKEDLTVRECVSIIADALGRRPPRVGMPLWLGIGVGRLFDLFGALLGKNLRISAARVKKLATSSRFEASRIKGCGFTPRYSIEEGIRNMVAWYLERGRAQASLEYRTRDARRDLASREAESREHKIVSMPAKKTTVRDRGYQHVQ